MKKRLEVNKRRPTEEDRLKRVDLILQGSTEDDMDVLFTILKERGFTIRTLKERERPRLPDEWYVVWRQEQGKSREFVDMVVTSSTIKAVRRVRSKHKLDKSIKLDAVAFRNCPTLLRPEANDRLKELSR